MHWCCCGDGFCCCCWQPLEVACRVLTHFLKSSPQLIKEGQQEMSCSVLSGILEAELQYGDPSKAVNFLQDEFSFNSRQGRTRKCFILLYSCVVTFTKRDWKTFGGILSKISYAISVTWISFFFSWLQIQSGEGPTRELPQVTVCRVNHFERRGHLCVSLAFSPFGFWYFGHEAAHLWTLDS